MCTYMRVFNFNSFIVSMATDLYTCIHITYITILTYIFIVIKHIIIVYSRINNDTLFYEYIFKKYFLI